MKRVVCPNCRHSFELRDDYDQKMVRCPQCRCRVAAGGTSETSIRKPGSVGPQKPKRQKQKPVTDTTKGAFRPPKPPTAQPPEVSLRQPAVKPVNFPAQPAKPASAASDPTSNAGARARWLTIRCHECGHQFQARLNPSVTSYPCTVCRASVPLNSPKTVINQQPDDAMKRSGTNPPGNVSKVGSSPSKKRTGTKQGRPLRLLWLASGFAVPAAIGSLTGWLIWMVAPKASVSVLGGAVTGVAVAMSSMLVWLGFMYQPRIRWISWRQRRATGRGSRDLDRDQALAIGLTGGAISAWVVTPLVAILRAAMEASSTPFLELNWFEREFFLLSNLSLLALGTFCVLFLLVTLKHAVGEISDAREEATRLQSYKEYWTAERGLQSWPAELEQQGQNAARKAAMVRENLRVLARRWMASGAWMAFVAWIAGLVLGSCPFYDNRYGLCRFTQTMSLSALGA